MIDHFNWKNLTDHDIAEIFTGISFRWKPRWHQSVCLAFAASLPKPRIKYICGVGTGKTILGLYTAQLVGCKKILVVCPPSAFTAWERDISGGTHWSHIFLTGTAVQRRQAYDTDADVYIINYEGLKTIFADMKKDGTGKGSYKLNWNKLRQIPFDGLILDEFHRCANYKTLQTKICKQISSQVHCVIGMTGTATDKSLLELFNIYKVVDLGETFGDNFMWFRQKYFYQAGFNWKPKKGTEEVLHKKMAPTTISFSREECLDLPDLADDIIEIEPSQEFLDAQHSLILAEPDEDDIIHTHVLGHEITIPASQRKNKLLQLSCGFMYLKDEDEPIILSCNPKIKTGIDMLEDIDSKVIIFYPYICMGKILRDTLQYHKIKYATIQGGQTHKDRAAQLKTYSTKSNVRVLTCQQSCVEGWDGTAGYICIFMLPVGSPKLREQAIGRISRDGQESRKCIVYDFVLKNSVDKDIIKNRGPRFDMVATIHNYMEAYHTAIEHV